MFQILIVRSSMTTKNDYGRPEFVTKLSEWRPEIYSFQVLWVDFPKLPLKMAINIKLFKQTIIGTLALLIFDRNLILMPFPVITHILSISVSQTCGSLWPGLLIFTFTSGNRPTSTKISTNYQAKNQNYPYWITGLEKLVYVPGNGQIAYFCTF